MKLMSSIESTPKQTHFHSGHKIVKQINIPTKNIFRRMSWLYFNVQHTKRTDTYLERTIRRRKVIMWEKCDKERLISVTREISFSLFKIFSECIKTQETWRHVSEPKNWGSNRALKTDAVKHPGRESITDAAIGCSSGHGRNVSFISRLLSAVQMWMWQGGAH